MTYASTLNKLLSIYREPKRRYGILFRLSVVMGAFHDLHEATQQTRLIFETEPGLVVNMHVRSHLFEIEVHFLAIAEILERDFSQSPSRPASPAVLAEQHKY